MTTVFSTITTPASTGVPGALVEIDLITDTGTPERPGIGYESATETVIEDTWRGRTDADGKWSVDLVPNDDPSLVPSNTYYRVTEWPTPNKPRVHRVLVTTSLTPVWLGNLLRVQPGDLPTPDALTQHIDNASDPHAAANYVIYTDTPGGELGGTFLSPTVDALHSGSTHAQVQSAAEATAAADVATHTALPNAHHATNHDLFGGTHPDVDSADVPTFGQVMVYGITTPNKWHAETLAGGSMQDQGVPIPPEPIFDMRDGITLTDDPLNFKTIIEADTTFLATRTYADSAQSAAEATAAAALAGHEADTTNIHGIANTAVLETQSGAQTKANSAQAAAEATAASALAGHVAAADPHTVYQLKASKGAANGYASLDGAGKIPTAQLPALAITDTFPVASQAAMLALSAERGDVAIRTDLSKSFILTAEPASTLGNWSELLSPPDAVTSVDGRVGSVTLTDLYDASGAATTAVSGHVAASDPHADRAFATTAVSNHTAIAGAHHASFVQADADALYGRLATTNNWAQTQTMLADFSIDASGTSEASPRVGAFTNMSSGNAVRWTFGDVNNGFQNAYGKDLQLWSYWGMEFIGGRQLDGRTDPANRPAFTQITTVHHTFWGTKAGSVNIRATSAAGQTASIQEWTDSSLVPLMAVTASGKVEAGFAAGTTSAAMTFGAKAQTGTNAAPLGISVGGGIGTGTGAGGAISFFTSTALSAGGTTAQTLGPARVTISQGAATTDAWTMALGANGRITLAGGGSAQATPLLAFTTGATAHIGNTDSATLNFVTNSSTRVIISASAARLDLNGSGNGTNPSITTPTPVGTDLGGSNLALAGGRGTGGGTPGSLVLYTATTLTTGTTAQTNTARVTISSGDVTTDAWTMTVGTGGTILAPDGSASNPVFGFSAEPSTGFRRLGSGNISVQSGGITAIQFGGGASPVIQAVDLTAGPGRSLAVRAGSVTAGTDSVSGGLVLTSGKGTGAGTGGTVKIQTATTLASGTTQQTLVDRITVSQGTVTTDAWTMTLGANGRLNFTGGGGASGTPTIAFATGATTFIGNTDSQAMNLVTNSTTRFSINATTARLDASSSGSLTNPNYTMTTVAGTDAAGLANYIAGGKGTGAGAPGSLVFATGTTLTGPSTTSHTHVARLTISQGAVTTDASTATWAEALDFIFGTTTGTKIGTATTQKIGFWGATPVVRQTVTGSRTGGAALTDLLTKLATAGIITDSTSV